MGRRIVSLCIKDKRYLTAFSDYCIRNEGGRMLVKTFDTKEALDRYEKNNHVDLILLDAAFAGHEKLLYKSKVAILSEEKYVGESEYTYVYKFQRIDTIIKQIYGIFAEEDEGKLYKCSGNKNLYVLGIFSPCFSEQREQYARELAAVYGRTKKVLYINLAELTEHDCEIKEGISELIYYIHESSKSASYRLLAMLNDEEGYKSVSGVKHYRDLYDISSDDVDRLFECIDAIDEFDMIVIDAGFMGDSVYDVLAHCNDIHMPVMDERSMRIKHLWHDMAVYGREQLINDIKVIQLPAWWSERQDMRSKWVSYEK